VDNTGGGHDSLDKITGPITALRAALAISVDESARVDALRPQRDTKQSQILEMLRREEGASGPQIAEAMGWAPHTVRGFLAGLAKKWIRVEVLERVRQVGPNKQGAKGSYTIYRLAAEAEG
jgi:predicted ArsR family transcriptional regulator